MPKVSKLSSSKRVILLLAILATLSMVFYAQLVLGHYSQCFRVADAANSMGLSLGYSVEDVLAFVQVRSHQQLTCYIEFLRIWDSIFPLLYTLMYAFWIIFLFAKWRYLLILPIVRMISDWTENYVEISFIKHYLQNGVLDESLISTGSLVTTVKWSLSIPIYALLIYGIIRKIRYSLTPPNE